MRASQLPGTLRSSSLPTRGLEGLTPTGTEHTPDMDRLEPSEASIPSRKEPASTPSLLTRLVGSAGRKALLTGAVAAAIMGASFVQISGPEAAPRVGAEIVAVERAAPGTEIPKLFDGLTQVLELLEPLGLSKEEARSSLVSISASVALPEGHLRRLDDKVSIEAEPGARLYAHVDGSGISFTLNPGLDRIVDWGIDSKINRVAYHFDTGTFTAHAEGLGPDGWHADGVQAALTNRFGPKLPSAMRAPGYAPSEDPKLAENFQQIFEILRPNGAGSVGHTELAAPGLSISLVIPKAIETSLAEGDYVARVAPGTRMDISITSSGPVHDLSLSSVSIRFSSPVEISKGTERAIMKRLDLSGLTIRSGGEITADYELGAEGAIDGVRALAALIAVTAEPRLANGMNLQPTRLTGVRAEISKTIDEQVEPALRSFIRTLDFDVGGSSLAKVFGLSPVSPDAMARVDR